MSRIKKKEESTKIINKAVCFPVKSRILIIRGVAEKHWDMTLPKARFGARNSYSDVRVVHKLFAV